MSFKSAIAVGIAVGVVGMGVAHATYARIESMGKNSTFVMDDISIFDNPANINIYPNYLIGEFGPYQNNNLKPGTNEDPQHPWFGGIFSLPLGQEDSRDPRLSIAGAFNRIDDKLFQFLPDSVRIVDKVNSTIRKVVVPTPATNFDGFLGGTLPNGNALGVHIYVAQQQGGHQTGTGYEMNKDEFASIVKADGGLNWQFNTDVDGELSAGVGRIQFGAEKKSFLDPDLMTYTLNGRIFSTWALINGEFVPAFSVTEVNAQGITSSTLTGGLGVNVALDRGFFWLGAEGIFQRDSWSKWAYNTTTGSRIYTDDGQSGSWDVKTSTGGRISFGIERNIWWDWFVIRVGGSKVITYVDCKHNVNNTTAADMNGYTTLCPESGNYFYTNPTGDGSWNDNVGVGFGINVEEKLKVDATVAEDVLFRNPFQGEGRLLSRISATYSF